MPSVFHKLLPDFSQAKQDKGASGENQPLLLSRVQEQRWAPAFVAEASLVDLILIECQREVKLAGLVLEPYTREPTASHWLDLGGIAWAHRKLYELEVDGLKLTVPAKDVGDYFEMAEAQMGRKEFASSSVTAWGQGHRRDLVIAHRVPVHPVDLWLWPHQLEELRAKLVTILPEAAAIATAENQRHNEQLAEGQRLGLWTGKPRPVGRSEEG